MSDAASTCPRNSLLCGPDGCYCDNGTGRARIRVDAMLAALTGATVRRPCPVCACRWCECVCEECGKYRTGEEARHPDWPDTCAACLAKCPLCLQPTEHFGEDCDACLARGGRAA